MSKIIICGISRDNARELPSVIKNIEKSGKSFEDYRVVIFENDSKDGTKTILDEWGMINNKVKILSEDFKNSKRPSIAFMAMCRNKYLEEIQKPEYNDFDYVMVVDMDMSSGWDISDSMSKNNQWDAVCSNGVTDLFSGKMYDMFAFRNQEFSKTPKDPDYWSVNVPTGQKQYKSGPLIPVDSCFGGMAIYKKSILDGCLYESFDGDCEHIGLHSCLKDKNGGKMFMNPNQILNYNMVNISDYVVVASSILTTLFLIIMFVKNN